LTKRFLVAGLLGLLALSACARTTTTNARPADFYAASPTMTDVRQLFGDNNWWALPPRFGVHPLNADRMSMAVNYQVTQTFVHLGTAELLSITYYVFDSTSTATTQMSDLQTASGTGATGAKLGDQVLYYGQMDTTSAAPYIAIAYVRVGSSITTVAWTRKDSFPTVSALSTIAKRATSKVKDVVAGKLRASPQPTLDASQLPPAGLNITLLGSTRISVESLALAFGSASAPQQVVDLLHQGGVTDALYGDYALNADTHMEVRATLVSFSTTDMASEWLNLIRGSTPLDASGIFGTYEDATGQYIFAFAAGNKFAQLTCSAAGPSEAAARACEIPIANEASAWQLSLGG